MSEHYPGSNLSRYFAARGVELSPDESRELVRLFLRLADLGALSVATGPECRGSKPKTTAPAVVSCADRGRGTGRERFAGAPCEGPTVYNVAPRKYMGSME
jgi:hypothetical protein